MYFLAPLVTLTEKIEYAKPEKIQAENTHPAHFFNKVSHGYLS